MKAPQSILKHQQVEAEIRQLIQTLPVGAKLPAERDLAISYDCNFLTVRKALKRLVSDGTVVRKVGSGTFIARHLRDNPSSSVRKVNRYGILVFQESNAYAYRLLQSVARASVAEFIDLRSIWVRDFGESTLSRVEQLKRDGCKAVIIPWFPHERVSEVRQFVSRSPLPVTLALVIPGLEKNCCFVEEPSVPPPVIAVCRYFYELGSRRIALLGPDSPADVVLQRILLAYSFYTSRERLPNLCGLVGPGARAMDRLAEQWKTYRGEIAIVCYDDEHALRFITSMHKLGLSAPADFSIIGFNDTESSRYADPPLTTIHQNFDYYAQCLLKSAQAMAQGRISQGGNTPKPRMLVRESCGGRRKITDAVRAQLPELDIEVEKSSAGAHELHANGAASNVVRGRFSG